MTDTDGIEIYKDLKVKDISISKIQLTYDIDSTINKNNNIELVKNTDGDITFKNTYTDRYSIGVNTDNIAAMRFDKTRININKNTIMSGDLTLNQGKLAIVGSARLEINNQDISTLLRQAQTATAITVNDNSELYIGQKFGINIPKGYIDQIDAIPDDKNFIQYLPKFELDVSGNVRAKNIIMGEYTLNILPFKFTDYTANIDDKTYENGSYTISYSQDNVSNVGNNESIVWKLFDGSNNTYWESNKAFVIDGASGIANAGTDIPSTDTITKSYFIKQEEASAVFNLYSDDTGSYKGEIIKIDLPQRWELKYYGFQKGVSGENIPSKWYILGSNSAAGGATNWDILDYKDISDSALHDLGKAQRDVDSLSVLTPELGLTPEQKTQMEGDVDSNATSYYKIFPRPDKNQPNTIHANYFPKSKNTYKKFAILIESIFNDDSAQTSPDKISCKICGIQLFGEFSTVPDLSSNILQSQYQDHTMDSNIADTLYNNAIATAEIAAQDAANNPNDVDAQTAMQNTALVRDELALAASNPHQTKSLSLQPYGGKVGISTVDPKVTLDISAVDAIIVPTGTTEERPTGNSNDLNEDYRGSLRFNTTDEQFEGYDGNNWSGLGGVISLDQKTKIEAENEDGLIFKVKNPDKKIVTLTLLSQSKQIEESAASHPDYNEILPNIKATIGTIVEQIGTNNKGRIIKSFSSYPNEIIISADKDMNFTLGDRIVFLDNSTTGSGHIELYISDATDQAPPASDVVMNLTTPMGLDSSLLSLSNITLDIKGKNSNDQDTIIKNVRDHLLLRQHQNANIVTLTFANIVFGGTGEIPTLDGAVSQPVPGDGNPQPAGTVIEYTTTTVVVNVTAGTFATEETTIEGCTSTHTPTQVFGKSPSIILQAGEWGNWRGKILFGAEKFEIKRGNMSYSDISNTELKPGRDGLVDPVTNEMTTPDYLIKKQSIFVFDASQGKLAINNHEVNDYNLYVNGDAKIDETLIANNITCTNKITTGTNGTIETTDISSNVIRNKHISIGEKYIGTNESPDGQQPKGIISHVTNDDDTNYALYITEDITKINSGEGTYLGVNGENVIFIDDSRNVAIGYSPGEGQHNQNGKWEAGYNGQNEAGDNIPITPCKLDISGATRTHSLIVKDDIHFNGQLKQNGLVIKPFSAVQYEITVGNKTSNHLYHNESGGSEFAYFINGIESPILTLEIGKTYRFKDTNNVLDPNGIIHPLKFYPDKDKSGSAYPSTYDNTNNEVVFTVPEDAPIKIYYQCGSHSLMGTYFNTPQGIPGPNFTVRLEQQFGNDEFRVYNGLYQPGEPLEWANAPQELTLVRGRTYKFHHQISYTSIQKYIKFWNDDIEYNTVAAPTFDDYVIEFTVPMNAPNTIEYKAGVDGLGGTKGANINIINSYNEKIYYDDGYVGIGTNDPGKTLDVHGDIRFTGTLYKGNEEFEGGGGAFTVLEESTNAYYDDGNVGIGTNNPTNYKLHIHKSSEAAGINLTHGAETTTEPGFTFNLINNDATINNTKSGSLIFKTNNTEMIKLNSNIESNIHFNEKFVLAYQIIPEGTYTGTIENITITHTIPTDMKFSNFYTKNNYDAADNADKYGIKNFSISMHDDFTAVNGTKGAFLRINNKISVLLAQDMRESDSDDPIYRVGINGNVFAEELVGWGPKFLLDVNGVARTHKMIIGDDYLTDTGGNGETYKLDVNGNIRFTGTLYKETGSNVVEFKEGIFTANGGNYYYNDGNIGIGTDQPGKTLDVTGDIRFTNKLYKGNVEFKEGIFTANTPGNYYYNGGKIGIGTDPGKTLDVHGDIRFTGKLYKGSVEFVGGGSGAFTVSGSDAYYIEGNVGIGKTNPNYTLDVNGEIHASSNIVAYSSSDRRLKNNIKPIDNPLEKLKKINGYTFEWVKNKEIHSFEGNDIGVIAQEIEEVLPEVTTTRENGYKAVRYEKMVPFLISCIKEQQKQIDELKELLKK